MNSNHASLINKQYNIQTNEINSETFQCPSTDSEHLSPPSSLDPPGRRQELEAQSRKTDDAVDRLGRRLEERVETTTTTTTGRSKHPSR